MVKPGSIPTRAAWLRRSRAQKPWKVPTQTLESGASASIRSRISPAALLVKVMARMFSGGDPRPQQVGDPPGDDPRLARPAPARTSSGPSMWVTASRWAAVRSASKSMELGSSCVALFGLNTQVYRPARLTARSDPRSRRSRQARGKPLD